MPTSDRSAGARDFARRFGPWAVVAGGSDGIGEAFCHELARRGLHLVPIARRREPLEALAERVRADHGVEVVPLQADLAAPDIGVQVARATGERDVGLLVYNAGASRAATEFADTALDDVLFLERLNVQGPLVLSHDFARRFRARGRGGIVLMSSLAGLSGCHYQAAYAATKSFVTTLAEGLWHELAPHGVAVTGVAAGATRTPTLVASGGSTEGAMEPAVVAAGALDFLGRGPVWVPGEANQAAARAMWPVPRAGLVNGMSAATGQVFGLPATPVEGAEFDA